MLKNRSTIVSLLIVPLLLSACEQPARVDTESLSHRLVYTIDENDKITVKDGLDNTIQPIAVDPADPLGSIVKRYKDQGKDIQITNGGPLVFFRFIGSHCRCTGSGNNVYCVPVGCG